MAQLRESIAAFLFLTFSAMPVWSASSATFGTVLLAKRAHIGMAAAAAGTTVFGGDKISTDPSGNIQIRAGAARLMLRESSSATISELNGTPSATLLGGAAVFSTALANAFAMRAATAEIRPQNDGPTIAQVSIISSKELIVRSARGALTITVDGETQVIPEATAYRVILDQEAIPEPQGAGTNDFGWPPRKAGKSHFYIVYIAAVVMTSVATYFAVDEVFESPDKP
jgi:hypothetical protein